MDKKEHIHAGHRQRMTNKLLQSPNAMLDHELLEVLLYSVMPRKNTNPLAHKLLATFGNLPRLFRATKEELMTIDGVGNKIASEIIVVGKIAQRLTVLKETKESLNSTFNIKKIAIQDFEGLLEEKLLVYLLDKDYKKIVSLLFVGKYSQIAIDVANIANAIAIHKPQHVVMVHNHPSGDVNPSEWDDLTTKKIHLICTFHGVNLADHIIIHGENTFSYFLSGKLDELKQNADLKTILSND